MLITLIHPPTLIRQQLAARFQGGQSTGCRQNIRLNIDLRSKYLSNVIEPYVNVLATSRTRSVLSQRYVPLIPPDSPRKPVLSRL